MELSELQDALDQDRIFYKTTAVSPETLDAKLRSELEVALVNGDHLQAAVFCILIHEQTLLK